jgi:hypothetical protein
MGVGIGILAICALFFSYPWLARVGERIGQWVSDRNQAHYDKQRAYMREVRRQPRPQ